ncbi:peptidase [Calothrix sp. HK-06]|nr:peptidase [Calothrix sp. HK-06]
MSVNLFEQNVSIQNLSINQSTQIVTNSISAANTEDYYRFNFSGRSSLNLAVNGLYSNANLQVLNSDGQELAGSYNRRNRDESVNITLEAGNYYIKVFRFKNATTTYNLQYSTNLILGIALPTPSITNLIPEVPLPTPSSTNLIPEVPLPTQSSSSWLDTVFQDAQMRADIKSFSIDGTIDRSEVIRILRTSEDNGVVDTTEFKDLQNLVSNASRLGIPEYVQVLTNKVVNGDVANQRYQNNPLGNLTADSNSTLMDNLVNKWFLGRDYPTSAYTYQQASGVLFQNGVNYQDIKQGVINDCFFLVGLAATAIQSPTTIENMFIDNGDNTYTVKFFRNQVADYVTVDKYLPTDLAGKFVYASKGSSYNNPANELWVALAEKAYAQLNESGWIYQDNTNSYSGIGKGGYISDAFSHITGQTVSMSNVLSLESLTNAISMGKSIGFGSKSSGVAPDIVASHAYALVNYDASTQTFTLFNPWGIESSSKPSILQLNWNQILANFSYWDGAFFNT